jgi:hypothetical protein
MLPLDDLVGSSAAFALCSLPYPGVFKLTRHVPPAISAYLAQGAAKANDQRVNRALSGCDFRNRLVENRRAHRRGGLGNNGRLYEFSQDHGGTPEENQAIRDALSGLMILRREVAARAAQNSLKNLKP